MNRAHQALQSLDTMTLAEVAALTHAERERLRGLCTHWAALVERAGDPPSAHGPGDRAEGAAA